MKTPVSEKQLSIKHLCYYGSELRTDNVDIDARTSGGVVAVGEGQRASALAGELTILAQTSDTPGCVGPDSNVNKPVQSETNWTYWVTWALMDMIPSSSMYSTSGLARSKSTTLSENLPEITEETKLA